MNVFVLLICFPPAAAATAAVVVVMAVIVNRVVGSVGVGVFAWPSLFILHYQVVMFAANSIAEVKATSPSSVRVTLPFLSFVETMVRFHSACVVPIEFTFAHCTV